MKSQLLLLLLLGLSSLVKAQNALPDTTQINQQWSKLIEDAGGSPDWSYRFIVQDSLISRRPFDIQQPSQFEHSLQISFKIIELFLAVLVPTNDSRSALKFYDDEILQIESTIARAYQLYEKTRDPHILRKAFQLRDQIKEALFQKTRGKILSKNEPELKLYGDSLAAIIDDPNLIDEQSRLNSIIAQIQLKNANPTDSLLNPPLLSSAVSLNPQFWNLDFLEEDQALVSYFIGHTSVYAFYLTNDPKKQLFYRVGTVPEIEEAIEKLYVGMDYHYNLFIENSWFLYQRLLKPAADAYGLPHRITLVTDGKLDKLPFDALLHTFPAHPDYDYSKLNYLLHDHQFSQAASALQFYQDVKSPRLIDETLLPLSLAPGFTGQHLSSQSISDSIYSRLVPIPVTIGFARKISRLYNGIDLVGKSATINALFQNQARFNCLNFATHAHINTTYSSGSSILLSKIDSPTEVFSDGYFSISRLIGQSPVMQQELVVLGSCESGRGRFARGEGEISFDKAFQLKGIPSVVYSLSPIQATTSCRILEYFFKHLAKGRPKDEALRQAKIDYLNAIPPDPETSSMAYMPAHWATIQLSGNTRPFQATSTTRFSLINIGFFLLLFGLLALMGKRVFF